MILLSFGFRLLTFVFWFSPFDFCLLVFALTAMGVYPHTDGDRGWWVGGLVGWWVGGLVGWWVGSLVG